MSRKLNKNKGIKALKVVETSGQKHRHRKTVEYADGIMSTDMGATDINAQKSTEQKTS